MIIPIKTTIFANKKLMIKEKKSILQDLPLPYCLYGMDRGEIASFVAINKGSIALRTLQEVFHSYDYLFDVTSVH